MFFPEINSLIIGVKYDRDSRRKRITQRFVSIPFDTFLKKMEYKSEELGIEVIRVEENYTSKCSFLDNEPVKKHPTYLGRRVKRGLFKSSQGHLINADVNAAYNILRKSEPKALPLVRVEDVGGYVIYPLSVSEQNWSHKQACSC